MDPGDLIELVWMEVKNRRLIGVPSLEIQLSHAAADAWTELLAFGGGLGAVDKKNRMLFDVPVVLTTTGAANDPIRIIG